ncbi:hypothetical protein [Iodidimonas sp. SYSU 1G8]|uniref:hypothetical protein n=1 Tax=Iodidimonas sp. SYSU 1G8 TaxID=3133967 RepID=UPI0031FECD74
MTKITTIVPKAAAMIVVLAVLGGCTNWNWGATGKNWIESVCRQQKKPCTGSD